MNTVNVRAYCIRPILAAGFALALAFTFTACSSDDKDDGGGGKKGPQWCSINTGAASGVMCFEVGKKIKDDIFSPCAPYAAALGLGDEDGFVLEGKCEELMEENPLYTLESSKPENCNAYHCTED